MKLLIKNSEQFFSLPHGTLPVNLCWKVLFLKLAYKVSYPRHASVRKLRFERGGALFKMGPSSRGVPGIFSINHENASLDEAL